MEEQSKSQVSAQLTGRGTQIEQDSRSQDNTASDINQRDTGQVSQLKEGEDFGAQVTWNDEPPKMSQADIS
jgi:hypothetical protein